MPMITLRSVLLAVCMAGSTLAAGVLTPKTLYSAQHYGQYKLEDNIPKQFGDWIKTEIGRWGTVIKATGTKAE